MCQERAIITFSHLRWNFVYQRPQHILSRLAQKRKVLYIEEPVYDPSGVLSWERSEPEPNLSVCRPLTPVPAGGFNDEQTPHLKRLLRQLIQEEELEDYLAWFYTPMALPLIDEPRPAALIYDCMNELSEFQGASPQMLAREEELLQRANLVFTAGPSLLRAKQNRSADMHCFPSSVDASHFAKAKDGPEAADQAALPHPRLGYFGVIDERLDLGLLDAMAQARPDWQIVMLGPVVKVDPAALPRRPNLHFLGIRGYAQLPEYLAGWDVCLLPFARNEATRCISPTRTLEYMAAELPIVSTPITGVADPYSDIVRLADTPAAFIAACEETLRAPGSDRACRVARMREVLSKTSWDATAHAMDQALDQAIDRQIAKTTAPSGVTAAPDRKKRILVVGAGPTGLSAAYHLGADSLLIEQSETVGGGWRSFEDRGFTFDHGGHVMASSDPYVHQMYRMLLGDNVRWQDRDTCVYSENLLQEAANRVGPDDRFGYPLRGGFQALMNGFLPHLKGELLLETRVVALSPKRRTVTLSDGQILAYEFLISTMPPPLLVRMAGQEAPLDVRAAAEGLGSVSVRRVNLGIGREKLAAKHWIYYPEDTVFHRIFLQGNASPFCNPPGGFGLTCEIAYSPYKPLPCDGDALVRRCIEDCHRVGIFTPGDPVWTTNQVDIRHAYVINDHARRANVKIIAGWMAGHGILIDGRYGEWEYYNSDHAFLAGKKVADRVRALQRRMAGDSPAHPAVINVSGIRTQESVVSMTVVPDSCTAEP